MLSGCDVCMLKSHSKLDVRKVVHTNHLEHVCIFYTDESHSKLDVRTVAHTNHLEHVCIFYTDD